MNQLPAILEALAAAKEKNGYSPSVLRLPSCMYRLLCKELDPILSYDATNSGMVMIAGVSFNNTQDGT